MQTHPARKPFVALVLAVAVVCLGGGCTPSGPRALLQGAALIRKGKYEAAITKLKIATDLIRNDARAWNYLGLAYHGAGQYGEAIIAYQRAQQLDQNLAEARYNLGELYLEQGNPVSAADEFTIFTALRPKSIEGWIRLGDANLQNQRYDRAQTSYYVALNLKRETPEAWNGLGLILLERKNPKDAYRYFVEANKYDANYAPAILNMAVVAQSHLNALPTALMKYREYLAKAPDASNAGAVKAVIRRLDEIVNPHPGQAEHQTEVAQTDLTPGQPTNQTDRAATQARASVSEPANVVDLARTNVSKAPPAHGSAVGERPEAAVVTNSPHQATVVKPPAVTNKPPVQLARNDVKGETPPPKEISKTTGEKLEDKRLEKQEEKEEKPKPPPKTEQPAPVVKTTTAPPKAPPKKEQEVPLQEAKLEETSIQPAGEISPPGEIQPATTTAKTQATSRDGTTAPRPATAEADKVPSQNASAEIPRVTQESAGTEKKRGFFQRINPINLFHSRKSETPERPASEIVTPLPPETASNAVEPSTEKTKPEPKKETQIALSEVKPPPISASGPRYQYGKIKKPMPGNRAAAERLFDRGLSAQSLRDPAGAATFFAAAAQADPTYFAAHYNLGLVAYSEGQLHRALSAFETALVLEPNSADARYNFALTLQKAGFPADAAGELEKLLSEHPNDTRGRLLLGNVYAQDLHDAPAARLQYEKVLELEPQHPQATAIRYWLVQHP